MRAYRPGETNVGKNLSTLNSGEKKPVPIRKPAAMCALDRELMPMK